MPGIALSSFHPCLQPPSIHVGPQRPYPETVPGMSKGRASTLNFKETKKKTQLSKLEGNLAFLKRPITIPLLFPLLPPSPSLKYDHFTEGNARSKSIKTKSIVLPKESQSQNSANSYGLGEFLH